MNLLPIAAAAGLGLAVLAPAQAQQLTLEARIPLGAVKGRIDHMAVDLARNRLFVAELGNDSLGVVDLKERKVIRRIAGIGEPQGVGYFAATDTVYVASGDHGTLSQFRGAELKPEAPMALGRDADNVRIDAAAGRIYVGYSGGAIAVIDAAGPSKLADIPVPAHPEGFQLSADRIFVNTPSASQIAVIDRAAGRQVDAWHTPNAGANFPMAIDPAGGHLLVVTRGPARLFVFDLAGGKVVRTLETCGDSDDVFVDPRRKRIYVSCGEGLIDVFDSGDGSWRRERIKTVSGARTSLFVPELDRLFVAVRASSGEPAAVWVFRPGA